MFVLLISGSIPVSVEGYPGSSASVFLRLMRVRLVTQGFGQAESMLVLVIPPWGSSENAGDSRLGSINVVLEPSRRTDEMLPQI